MNLDDFEFRDPLPSEAALLAGLGQDTFIETFGHLYSAHDLQAFLEQVHGERAVGEELLDPSLSYHVVTSGDAWVGYIKIGPVYVPVEPVPHDAMEVRQLYVREAYTRCGLGRRLMEWAMTQFSTRNVTELFVSVYSENQRAIEFYKTFGFAKIGEYGFPVGEQIDREWIMHTRRATAG